MSHHHRGRRFEAGNEQAHLVIDREVEGTMYGGEAFAAEPGFCRGKERSEDPFVIHGVEETELPSGIGMMLEAQPVHLRRDPTDRLIVVISDKKPDLRMPEVRVPGGIEMLLALEIERRDPVRVMGENPMRHAQKGVS